jgi:hypothetical protein
VVSETPGVDGVHRGEVVHPREVDGRLHDVVQRQSRGLQDRFDVVEHPLDRRVEPARHESAGGGIQRNLAGGEEEAPLDDRLGIRTNGLRSLVDAMVSWFPLAAVPLRYREPRNKTMSVERIQLLHEDYIRLTERFKALWTFHQFLRGVQKTFFASEPSYALDFSKLYGGGGPAMLGPREG